MRLTLSQDDAIGLKIKLERILEDKELSNKLDFKENDNEEFKLLIEQIEKNLNTPAPQSKKLAAKRATIIRQDRVKEKIRNAVNLLHLENGKINVNSVSKKSGVAYNTVKKYSYLIYQID